MNYTNESLIISSLVLNEEYVRKTLPYIKDEYFSDTIDKTVFTIVKEYLTKYNTLPNKTTLLFDLKDTKLSDDDKQLATDYISNLYEIDRPTDENWLIKQTEDFCKNKAIYNAIVQSIEIYDGNNKNYTTHAIPSLITDALSVNFDNHIGMDFYDDAEKRFEYYSRVENKIQFDIDILNKITGGGVNKKSLNLILAGVFVGKSLSLVHLAAAYVSLGYNVLYISMEMREEEVFKRVDANILKVPTDKLQELGVDTYTKRINKLKQKTNGLLKVKEYAPCSAHSGHFNHLIQELKLKQRFKPDVIMVDYLGIVSSSRQKSSNAGSHTYLTSVAEELRALAFEHDVPLWSAQQLNRTGASSSEAEMTDIGGSFGIPATADFILSLARTEELDAINQLLAKVLKNRYRGSIDKKRFCLGVDIMTQTLYNLDESQQDNIMDDSTPIPTGKELKDKFVAKNKNKFSVLDKTGDFNDRYETVPFEGFD